MVGVGVGVGGGGLACRDHVCCVLKKKILFGCI